MKASRTYRTIQNARTSIFFFILQVLLGFYSRKVFLDSLGAEILGLNTTLGNILGFINLAEMGIGVAMASSLYEPIFKKEQNKINEILSVQSILYRKIAYLFLIISIPLLCLFPIIFKEINASLLYAYVAYLVFLWGTISGYLWNYKSILLSADQKNYMLMPYIQGGRIVKTIIQILLLVYWDYGCWGWIFLEFLFSCIIVICINCVVKREYPWLNIYKGRSKELLSKHKDLMTQTKQLFFHKIGTYILYESSPLVIYACVSLSMVTFYGNYMILIGYAVTLLNVIFEGMGASIGNLVAENNKEHTMEVFWELFTSRFWLAAVCCFVTYIFVSPFIVLWIGEEYLLDKATLVLMIVSMFIRISRSVIDSFKNAYKLFADIWAPVIEAAINLSLSLLLGYYWGLNGILIGVNISLIVIVIFWKPYYVYKRGFCISIKGYIKEYIVHLVLTAIAIIACVKIENYINLNPFDSYYSLIAYMVIMSLLFICISYGLFFLFTSGMRMFSKRILILLKIK